VKNKIPYTNFIESTKFKKRFPWHYCW